MDIILWGVCVQGERAIHQTISGQARLGGEGRAEKQRETERGGGGGGVERERGIGRWEGGQRQGGQKGRWRERKIAK